MSFFQKEINGDVWTFYVVPDDDEVIAEGSAAETDFVNKEVHFRRDAINITNVRHELYHVYASYLYLADTNEITIADYEEISAAMFADRGKRMLEMSDFILQKLQEIRDNEDQD